MYVDVTVSTGKSGKFCHVGHVAADGMTYDRAADLDCSSIA